ncbi:hypothetical protein llap_6351 [Limosa lapponica baueri]|uniref:Uncharacterized protein n=1 Tax=Limosa lapponica baueri TaxID=1758121 RepID=A0A2I0UBA4_LIMLA|nr:hypothetical protein llap_6351 [Limosa lapponica baueri]
MGSALRPSWSWLVLTLSETGEASGIFSQKPPLQPRLLHTPKTCCSNPIPSACIADSTAAGQGSQAKSSTHMMPTADQGQNSTSVECRDSRKGADPAGSKAPMASLCCKNCRHTLSQNGPEEPWQVTVIGVAKEGEKPLWTSASFPRGKSFFLAPDQGTSGIFMPQELYLIAAKAAGRNLTKMALLSVAKEAENPTGKNILSDPRPRAQVAPPAASSSLKPSALSPSD